MYMCQPLHSRGLKQTKKRERIISFCCFWQFGGDLLFFYNVLIMCTEEKQLNQLLTEIDGRVMNNEIVYLSQCKNFDASIMKYLREHYAREAKYDDDGEINYAKTLYDMLQKRLFGELPIVYFCTYLKGKDDYVYHRKKLKCRFETYGRGLYYEIDV